MKTDNVVRVELRCPVFHKLLGASRIVESEDSGLLVELVCRECRNSFVGNKPLRVIHLFDPTSLKVVSEVVWE